MNWLHHLIILPILLPIVTAAALIPVDERNRTLKGVISVCIDRGGFHHSALY